MNCCARLPDIGLEKCKVDFVKVTKELSIRASGETKKVLRLLVKQYNIISISQEGFDNGDTYFETVCGRVVGIIEPKPIKVKYFLYDPKIVFTWEFTERELNINYG